jgi:hypothetical protein
MKQVIPHHSQLTAMALRLIALHPKDFISVLA